MAPPWFVPGEGLEERKVQNEVRTTLLQGLGGVVLGVGAYFTARQLKTSQQAQVIAREGQITERYTRAVDQLGHAEVDVRIGGIYALERIARDSPHDRPTIAEVLTSFVRGRAPWPPLRTWQPPDTTSFKDLTELRSRCADVQATVTVLARSGFAGELTLDLHQVDLRKADLVDAHLEGANLRGAHLEGANLAQAHLEGANLFQAHLEDAVLISGHLEGASLFQAHLEGALLTGADLRGARLDTAHLQGARLSGASLAGATLVATHLEKADLNGANLEGANLQRLTYDGSTRWPEGFDPPPSW